MAPRTRFLSLFAVLIMLVAACGGDDADGNDTDASAGTTSASAGTDTDSGSGGGGDAGFVTVGDETVTFESARCYLQPQDAAGGGGQILATGQGFGTTASGEPVSLDFTRYNEESQFAGDDINVTVGSRNLNASLDLGAVSIDGSRVSAEGFTFTDFGDFSETAGAFELGC